jgi:peptidyl-prolyl cis-trans isomerase A (cyclophilin A)
VTLCLRGSEKYLNHEGTKTQRITKKNITMRTLCFFLLLLLNNIAQAQPPDISVLKIKAPETFRAVFKTTKGDFVIEAYRKWSPLGVDRLYQLITTGFYKNALLFRVERSFVTQFGISGSYTANRFWDPKKLPDEPRLQKNLKGTISFARGGKNDRATQLFINTANNPEFDNTIKAGVKGYTPVAKVIRGMEVVAKFEAGYGIRPATIQDSLYKYGNFYFEERFPGLDKIISASITK